MTNQEEAKMTQEQADPEKQDNTIEITKARSRVTANTPAFFTNPHPFYFLFLNNMMFSGVVQTNSKPDSISFCPSAVVLAVAEW